MQSTKSFRVEESIATAGVIIAIFPLNVPKGMEDEICPYATFHLLGFREEMDPSKAMNFQTFPHQNGTATPGHTSTMGSGAPGGHMHSRSGSQSMVITPSENSLTDTWL